MSRSVRVLIADDSPTMRATLAAICATDSAISVVGQAGDGLEAVRLARTLRPDVVTMDVRMPKLDGLAAIRAIMTEAPTRIVVVCSPIGAIDDDLPFRAIQAGALELVAKPSVGRIDLAGFSRKLLESIRLMAAVPVVGRRLPHGRPSARVRVDAFGIVASTGGPPALATILGPLPKDFAAPILIAQHMAVGFARALAAWARSVTTLPVIEVASPTACAPGHVYFPCDEHDLEVDKEGVVRVRRSPGGHCPSGNRLLFSLAEAYGERAGGVVLTGMGEDGARGLFAIKHRGGYTIAQDEMSSAVAGMPRAALDGGAVSELTPLAQISDAMRAAVTKR
jgi:two-component system chemotaxis response regulator CheB